MVATAIWECAEEAKVPVLSRSVSEIRTGTAACAAVDNQCPSGIDRAFRTRAMVGQVAQVVNRAVAAYAAWAGVAYLRSLCRLYSAPKMGREIMGRNKLDEFSASGAVRVFLLARGTKIRQISKRRRLVEQISERKKQRRALAPFPSEVARAKEMQDQVEQTGAVLANLSLVAAATRQFYSTFQEFNPAATEYPLTLSGWRELEKAIRKGLGELDLGRKK